MRGSAAGGCAFESGIYLALASASGPRYAGSDLRVTPTPAVSDGFLGFDATTPLYTQAPLTDSSSSPRYTLDFPREVFT